MIRVKKKTYKLMTSIPIVGAIVKAITNPAATGVFGSNEMRSGLTSDISKKLVRYLSEHPDEQPTKQLIERLLSSKK